MRRFFAVTLTILMAVSLSCLTVFAGSGTSQTVDWTTNADKTVAVADIGDNGDWGYYATLVDALAAIRSAADQALYTVECKPNADVGAMTHGLVLDNIIINGNNAYVSGGEYDIAFESGSNLTKNITVTVNDLDGIAAWGYRTTDYTIDLVFNRCEHMNRVYITTLEGSGANNITLNACSFDRESGRTDDTGVYSNAVGTITIEDCSFKDIPVPINLNNKSNGTQNVTVSGCSFVNVAPTASDANYAAPIRLVASGQGNTTATVSNCTFANVTTANGDILLGDGRSGKTSSFNVDLTVEDTAAEVQFQNPARVTKVVNVDGDETASLRFHDYFAVAEVNGIKCCTLAEAIENADNDSTIVLCGDIVAVKSDFRYSTDPGTNHDYYTLGTLKNKKITLDLNGKSISIADGTVFDDTTPDGYETIVRIFRLNEGADLTIKGDGAVMCNATGNIAAGYAFSLKKTTDSVKLTIENGTIAGYAEVIYCTGTGDNVVIKGGTFKSYSDSGKSYILNAGLLANKDCFAVQGGTFEYVDPRYMNDGNLVADGYLVTRKFNEYTVIPNENIVATVTTASGRVYSYTSFTDAIAYANDGDTVKLLTNASGDGAVINKDITIDLNGKTYTISGNAVGSEGSVTNGFQLLRDNNITFKNGKITSTEDVQCNNNSRGDHNKLSILIQNYSNLTLDGVELDGANLLTDGYEPYALSNNNGAVNIKDSTITAEKGYAFDVYNSVDYDGVTVTVTNSTINGYVWIDKNTDVSTRAFLCSGDEMYSENGTYVQVGEKFEKAGKRSIEISANNTEVEMGDIVTIEVTIHGTNLMNVSYDLTYDPAAFELQNTDTGAMPTDGVFTEVLFKTDSACYADGAVIATYTFKALGQTENVTADFEISDANAHTYMESINGLWPLTASNEKVSVAIALKEYAIALSVDGSTVSGTTDIVHYRGEGHTFSVTATPAATVSYQVNNGAVSDSVSVADRGSYTIAYTITPALGYAEVSGTFTLVIGDPEYVVEVNLDATGDYVAGKKIVLVYTDVDGVAFKYGTNLMIDVTASGYKYNDTVQYRHVYAFVTTAIASDGEAVTVEDYSDNVSCVIPSPETLLTLTYSEDLNFVDGLTVDDITVAYGIYNVCDGYFANVKYQKSLLRADTDRNKLVDNDDTTAVVNAVLSAVRGN